MKYVKTPNLPGSPVQVVVVDGRVSAEIEEGLSSRGVSVIKTKRYSGLYEAIAFHPDMMLHHIGGGKMVYAPGTDKDLLNELMQKGFLLVEGETVLTSKYPGDIAYNVARVGRFALHSLKHTDPVLKRELDRAGVEFVDVKQGYAKCSVSVVSENSMITSDKGIAKAAEKRGIEVLLIAPDFNIHLPGISYGFIGGSSGLLDKDWWAVTGDFQTLQSAVKIQNFLRSKNIGIISLGAQQVKDMGSIIPLIEK